MSSERDDVSTEAETPRGRDEHGRFVRGGGAPTRSSNDEAELPGSGGDGVEDGNLDETPRRDVLSSDEGVTDEQVAAVTAEHARRKAMRAMEMEDMRQEMEFAKLRAQRIETEAADVKRQRDLEASLRAQERKQEEEELEFAVRKAELQAQERLVVEGRGQKARVPATASGKDPSASAAGHNSGWRERAHPALPKFAGGVQRPRDGGGVRGRGQHVRSAV